MKAWLLTAAALGLGALSGPAAAQIADVCRPVVEQDGSLVTLEEPRFSIANSPGILERVNVPGELAMVTCERRTIVPLPGDYRVIRDLGVFYTDDCLRLDVIYRKEDTVIGRLGPRESITFRLTLATLGGSGYSDRNGR